jgi:hypothetical protein
MFFNVVLLLYSYFRCVLLMFVVFVLFSLLFKGYYLNCSAPQACTAENRYVI